ncbi:hypothetical protein [Sphingobium sp. EM0848]|uniref:hypothetical protein n=1 Tax=Sphingobium sp. EM0848 TaxID=2743473 RepID=UPI00159CA58E|nr:hypothetical protein [Sphingobium sp. EM0848]
MVKSPLERAARALCSLEGNPENATFEGRPMWQSYLPQACAVLLAVRDPGAEVSAAGGEQISTEGFKIGAQIAGWTWDRMIGAILESK